MGSKAFLCPFTALREAGRWFAVCWRASPLLCTGTASLWTFTYNTDFAKGFCGLMGNPKAIGGGRPHHQRRIADLERTPCRSIGRAFGVEPHFVHISSDFLAAFNADLLGALLGDKAHSVVFDNSKIKRLVPGFCANICFDEGVRRCAAYIQAHPNTRRRTPALMPGATAVIAAYFSGLTARPSTGPASGAAAARKARFLPGEQVNPS